MNVRKSISADLPAIVRLNAQIPSSNWKAHDYQNYYGRGDAIFVVAEVDGQVVGFALSTSNQDLSELLQICVDDAYRQSGYGRALLEYTYGFLVKNSAFFLEVSENNKDAIALYEGFGFIRSRIRRDYYGLGNHAIELRKVV